MEASFLSTVEETLEFFQVDEQQGLSDQDVQKALERYGRNGTVHRHI
jgi:hypothetical protein